MIGFHYISSSVLPSRSANAVHVAHQCDALARNGAHVTLYAKRSLPDASAVPAAVSDAYGVRADAWRLVTYHSTQTRADTLRIAALGVAHLAAARPDAVLSRNLYAAYVLGVLMRRPLILESHDLEQGVRKGMQRAIMTRPWVTTIAISQAMVAHLERHHGVLPARTVVLHDAAPPGMQPLPPDQRRAAFARRVPEAAGPWDAVCAYFGHLYPGRGIDVIEAMAAARPRVFFAVFGGNDSDIAVRRASSAATNLRFMGHLPHAVAREAMAAADVLLMPYQARVSVGVANRDTAAFMSPMKMFEYMATGVPIISSDLPVLREVLRDRENAMLVTPSDPQAWLAALDRLVSDRALASRIGAAANADYLAHYTWDRRARAILAAAGTG